MLSVQVFVTCGTADKKAFLLEAFPRLREDHIGDSRSCSFEETVKRQTAGKGVHLALNSLADDKLQVRIATACPVSLRESGPRTCSACHASTACPAPCIFLARSGFLQGLHRMHRCAEQGCV